VSRYLTIARSATQANEIDEKSPSAPQVERIAHYEINEINEISPTPSRGVGRRGHRSDPMSAEHENSRLRLSCEEATALGLNPELVWVHVSRDEVEATVPPADWNGALPGGCRWKHLCQTLGPCPRHKAHDACHHKGETP
jgi:hypothetical protein